MRDLGFRAQGSHSGFKCLKLCVYRVVFPELVSCFAKKADPGPCIEGSRLCISVSVWIWDRCSWVRPAFLKIVRR